MISATKVEELADRIARIVPAAEQFKEDAHKNLRAVLNAALARMDLVTREEFDVQSDLLARTRAKLEAMGRQVAALEAELKERSKSHQSGAD